MPSSSLENNEKVSTVQKTAFVPFCIPQYLFERLKTSSSQLKEASLKKPNKD